MTAESYWLLYQIQLINTINNLKIGIFKSQGVSMANFIQVIDNKVVNHWDIFETLPSPLGTNGWKKTVEIIPAIIDGRQEYGVYTYDVTQDPVVISREIIDISVDERKNRMLSVVKSQFVRFLDFKSKTPDVFPPELVQKNITTSQTLKASIEEATTHDALDAIKIVELDLF